jgi:hypothetical protein
VKNEGSRGLTARNQGPKHNYTYKLKVYSVKEQRWTSGGKLEKLGGLNAKT